MPGGVSGDEIARRHPAVADPAGHRSLQFGEFEIEGRLPHRRRLGRDRGLGDALGLGALVEGLLGDGAFLDELRTAGEVGLGKGEIGLRLLEIALGLIERGLERPAVDGEQQIALFDHLPVGEMDAVEVAGHPGANFDAVDGDEAADIFVLIDHAALGRGGNGHLRRRRRRLLLRGLAAGHQHGKKCQHERASGGERSHEFSVGVTGNIRSSYRWAT